MNLEFAAFLMMTCGYLLLPVGYLVHKGQRNHHKNHRHEPLWEASAFMPYWVGFFLVVCGAFIHMYMQGWL